MRSFIHLAFAAVVRHSATVPTHITNTRSAEVVDAEIAALTETLAERNEGLVLYERDTDDKLAGAKSYSIDAIESPAQLNYFHAFISATGSFILHAISLASLATGCCGVGNAEEVSLPVRRLLSDACSICIVTWAPYAHSGSWRPWLTLLWFRPRRRDVFSVSPARRSASS